MIGCGSLLELVDCCKLVPRPEVLVKVLPQISWITSDCETLFFGREEYTRGEFATYCSSFSLPYVRDFSRGCKLGRVWAGLALVVELEHGHHVVGISCEEFQSGLCT